jgi:hypothetical protein
MAGIGRFLKTIRPLAHLLVCISGGVAVALSQTELPKNVDGWSKANWAMTAEQVRQAFKDEGAIPSKYPVPGLECGSAVEIPNFQFDAQDKKSPLSKAKFQVTFSVYESSHQLCRITIRPIRSVRFDDVKVMLIKLYGEPNSVKTDRMSPEASWSFPSTSISLAGDFPNNVDAIYFFRKDTVWRNIETGQRNIYFPKKTEERRKLFNPPPIQANVVPPLPVSERQSNESSPGAASTILSGKAFLITKGGDLMVVRFGQVFVLSGEAANQFSNNSRFGNYDGANYDESIESLENSRSIAPSSGQLQELLRLEQGQVRLQKEELRLRCILNLMDHFEMAVDLKKAYPTSVMTSESDEEGAFKVKGLRPVTYTVLVFGRGGVNSALWMDQVSVESGKDEPLKMHTTKLGCFDPQGLAKF